LDPRLDQEIASLETLMANFDKVSTNGTMTQADLQKASMDSSNPDLQKAAKFFLANPDCMNQLFGPSTDGKSATWDQMYGLDQGLSQLKAAAGGTQTVNGSPPGPTSTTPTSTTPTSTASTSTGDTGSTTTTTTSSGDYSDLIAKLDQEIADLAKKKTSTSTSSSKKDSYGAAFDSIDKQIDALEQDAKDHPENAQADFEKISKLNQQNQMLMEMMQQDFQRMSETLKAFNDMSMAAIRNING
jgi:hypothetical protein